MVELEDHRDRLLNELSKEVDVRILQRTTGEVVIYTTGGRALLDNTVTQLTHVAAAQLDAVISLGSGINGIGYGAVATDITTEIMSVRLVALIQVRDETMVDLQAEIDRLAETLSFRINALHNDGTSYPAPLTLTGERTLAATDQPTMTGSFRVAVVGATGLVVEVLDINLAALAPPSVGQLVTTINGMANAGASINAQGKVVISATGGNGVAVNEMTSAVTTDDATYGMAHFLGLNNFLDSADDYDLYASGRVGTNTSAQGLTGTLTFRHAAGTTAVAYVAGNSLATIAASITAALAAQNITATIVGEGSGYHLTLPTVTLTIFSSPTAEP